MSNSRLVYSSESGRICPGCGKPQPGCVCRAATPAAAGDGIVRVRRESKGRGGKIVTVVTGLPAAQLKPLCTALKQRCGSGGTIKEGALEIQGDRADLLVTELSGRGFVVKRAGG